MSTSQAVSISRVIPNGGSLAGGTRVAVLGSHFPPSSRCFFGSEEATITWRGESSLKCTSPPGRKLGPVSLTVRVGSGTFDMGDAAGSSFFTYQDDLYKELATIITSIVREPDGSEHNTVDTLRQPPAESVSSSTRSIQNEIASSCEFSTVDVQRIIIDLVRLVHDDPDPSDPDSGLAYNNEKLELGLTSELGRTLLHLSAALDFRELLYELVVHGVGLDHRDISGRTALHYAALYRRLECAKLLLPFASKLAIAASAQTKLRRRLD